MRKVSFHGGGGPRLAWRRMRPMNARGVAAARSISLPYGVAAVHRERDVGCCQRHAVAPHA